MLKGFVGDWKKKLFKIRSFLIAKVVHCLLHLLMKTCRIKIEGLHRFLELAGKQRCILMLWHNRMTPMLFILSTFAPKNRYTALVSASRDGDILSNIIESHKNGHTIRVPHDGRHQALKTVIHRIKKHKQVVVITPDGPRGPCYNIKPGIAVAALETQAYIIPVNWEANHFWEFNTWDKLRLPKPFSTLHVTFGPPIHFDQSPPLEIEEVKRILKEKLS
ncbi:MAG: lysophospholipid acyltransferase family protein [Parachlamydiaceae bacterium]